jgi:hypothetical protein
MGAWESQYISIVKEAEEMPKTYALQQNHPNPFNSATIISFALPAAGHVRISIYDILGREVERLADREMPAGNHQVVWNGSGMASGIYYYKMRCSGEKNITLSKKCVVMK